MENNKTYGVCRFKNIGATCYMNSILHILQELPQFQNFILNLNITDESNNTIYKSLYELLKLSSEHDNKVIIPSSFKKDIGNKSDIWSGYEQQDSQEFFSFLISTIEEEIGDKYQFIPNGNINNKKKYNIDFVLHNIIAQKSWFNYQLREYSLLKNIFNGLLRNKKTCSICGNNQYVYEPFITLSLSIPLKYKKESYDLTDCLNHFIEKERLTEDNKLTCDLCGVKNKFYSESMIWKTPDILVIQLKRFINNDSGIISEKINNNVSYPLVLNINNYIDNNSLYKNQIHEYHLSGINIHLSSGKNINFGHYISFVKNKLNNSWYIYNDENHVQSINEDNLIHSNAYLLFYVKKID